MANAEENPMADDCKKHRGSNAEISYLNQLMNGLPENQSGAGRHKCAYCAYEAGVAAGIKKERSRIAKGFNVEPDELKSI